MNTESGLFDQRPVSTLPSGTIDALMEIHVEAKRIWIEKIVLASVARNGNLDDLRRTLVWEHVGHDIIARIIDPLRSGGTT